MGRSVLRPYTCRYKVKGPIQISWTGPFLLPLSNFGKRQHCAAGLVYARAWRLAMAMGPTRGALWKLGGWPI